jgi:hypothetical protein
MTNQDLKDIFHLANSRYFRSRLKNVTIRWARPTDKISGRALAVTRSQHGKVPKGQRKFLILLSKELKNMSSVAVLTILHELVHCDQWDDVTDRTMHGRKFQKRMKQLAARGAFSGLW